MSNKEHFIIVLVIIVIQYIYIIRYLYTFVLFANKKKRFSLFYFLIFINE
jgi:hypothetical protein